MTPNETQPARDTSRHTAGVFDIRTLIAALIAIYGVILVLVGIVGDTEHNRAKTDDVNLNLWTGLALLVAAGAMETWALLRPVIVPADDEDQRASDS